MSTSRKVALATGASSGIGAATAKLLAEQGHHVVLGACRTERLKEITEDIHATGGSAEYHTLDVTDAEQVQAFVDAAHSRHGRVDVMVNNAGVMPLSKLEALRLDEWNRMIDVNIRGVLHGIAAALPVMRTQHHGHFINVASIGAHQVSPTAAVYNATKHAVWAISEGPRQEVGGDIRVTTVSPGVTESELAESISDPEGRERMRTYRSVAIPASSVAAAIAFAMDQPAGVDVGEIIVRPTAGRT
ncbi:SDR family oxidoreductase [Streptomyces mirabilis]|uniref:SDR family oxidoreductase n=1 Tax=Streptomyces mirabilis TaxID=68239 RepID=UPI00369227C7